MTTIEIHPQYITSKADNNSIEFAILPADEFHQMVDIIEQKPYDARPDRMLSCYHKLEVRAGQ